ncbi:MAG: hypothetical protein JF614_09010 [Acidobacteria bacterium]|nr:hypothetical protein [Acidobacteriota bacterium]
MQGSRVRRPLSWLILTLLALSLPLSWGCKADGKPPAAEAGSNPAGDEAERTRKMQDKAAEIDRKAEEIRNMQGTDEEKAEAVNKLDQERRELNEMQDQGKQ